MTCRKAALPAFDECRSLQHLGSSCSRHATGTSWLALTNNANGQPVKQTVSRRACTSLQAES